MATSLSLFLRRRAILTRLAPLCLGVALIAPGCGGDGPVGPVAVASVTVSGPTSLEEGKAAQFTATPRDEQGNVLAGRPIIWQTSNDAVATVSGDGSMATVTAKTTGPVTISATSEGRKGDAAVSVGPGPAIGLSGTTVSFAATGGQSNPAAQTISVTNGGVEP